MKLILAILVLTITAKLQAKSFYCAFSDESMGVLQIDIVEKNVKLCQFIREKEDQWKKVESGTGKYSHDFFDNSSYQTKMSYKIITTKREVNFSMPKNFKDGTKINISWDMASNFGPLISSGHTRGTSAICFYKPEALPCAAESFTQPKNTPKDFQKLKIILEKNERDWWGDRTTFTLVSPDLEDFTVFTQITDQGIEACSFGCVSANKEQIIQNKILPMLKEGWTMVPVYSNEEGIKFFKRLKN